MTILPHLTSARSFDLVVSLLVAVMSLLCGLIDAEVSALRVLLTLPLVLVITGYTVVEAAFPQDFRGAADRVALSIGLSFVIAVLGGLFLHFLGVGLRFSTWLVLESGVVIGASLVALIRRRNGAVVKKQLHPPFDNQQMVMLATAAFVTVVAYAVARFGAAHQPQTGFTQLWILPDVTTQEVVQIGIQSRETSSIQYELRVSITDADQVEALQIELKPGQLQIIPVFLRPMSTGAHRIDARLYRLSRPDEIYRHVALYISSE